MSDLENLKDNTAVYAAQIAASTATAAATAAATSAAAAASQSAQTAANSATAAALVGLNIDFIQKDIAEIKNSMKDMTNKFVTKDEFIPIKQVVYGLIGIILVTFVGAVLTIVLKK